MTDGDTLQVPLETLLELPLPAEALATVLRESMTWTAAPTLRRRLALELAVLELDRCRELGETSGWQGVIPRLETWETTWHHLCSVASEAELEPCRQRWHDAMARLEAALQNDLMQRLEAAPASERDAHLLRDWAELLWWCWERRDPEGGNPLLRERLCRLGAIAWLTLAESCQGRPGVLDAAGRAQHLLVELAGLTPPEVLWVRNGLKQGLNAHLASGPPADGDWRPWLGWAELIVARSPTNAERTRCEEQLWTARAALEIAATLGL